MQHRADIAGVGHDSHAALPYDSNIDHPERMLFFAFVFGLASWGLIGLISWGVWSLLT